MSVDGPGAADGGAAPGDIIPVDLIPVDNDGVGLVTAGTVLWLVALVVLVVAQDPLADSGRLWWIAAAAVGFGLGLLGIWYTWRRRAKLRVRAPRSG